MARLWWCRRAAYLVAWATLVSEARATPADTLGFGARQKGMGRAAAADHPDFSANYYSPANLAFAERPQLSFGYTQTNLALRYDGKASNLESATGWEFGVVAPGKIAGIPVAFGVAAHLPRGHISSSETIRESDPYWVLYQGRLQLLYTSVNLALRPLPFWSIAIGAATLATTEGTLDVRGTAVLPEFERSEYESALEHQVDARLKAVRYPQYSMAFELTDALRAQVSYREQASLESTMGAGLDAEVDGTLIQIPVTYDVLVESVRMFIPRQLGVSAAWRTRELTLALDLTYSGWSNYESPVSRSETHVHAEPPPGVTIDLPQGPAPPALKPPHFRDQWAPRFGMEYRVRLAPHLTLPLRCGYGYSRTPVPAQVGLTSFLDADQHLVSVGLGSVVGGLAPLLAGSLKFDVALQWGVLGERRAAQPEVDGSRTAEHSGTFLAASGDMTLEF